MAVSEKTALRHSKWKREILDIIRHTPQASRISVKRARGLSMDSTLALIGELIDEGLIISLGKTQSGKVGRKATLLTINPDGCYFIGIRFTTGGISGVVLDFALNIVCACRKEFVRQPSGEDMIDGIFSCIDQLLSDMGERRARLRGIGLGAPGIIDLQGGVISRYAHIKGWENIPLQRIIESRYAIPTTLEHGVKCSVRAIMPHQAERKSLLYLQMSRGVSLCVVIDGRILGGANYLAGEIGHMKTPGQPQHALESLIASDAICLEAASALERGDPGFDALRPLIAQGDRVHLESVIIAANKGCRGCRALLERAGHAAADALAASIMVVNPHGVILSGRLCASPFFEQAVRQTLHERCIPESLSSMQLSFMPADPQLDAVGAALLPFNREFGPLSDLTDAEQP